MRRGARVRTGSGHLPGHPRGHPYGFHKGRQASHLSAAPPAARGRCRGRGENGSDPAILPAAPPKVALSRLLPSPRRVAPVLPHLVTETVDKFVFVGVEEREISACFAGAWKKETNEIVY